MNLEIRTVQEKWRAETLLTKEPGTIRWIEANVRPGDVFYDIGSNIGLYALYAAERIGEGFVYAFEPHISTAKSLLKNVSLNDCGKRIHVVTSALHDTMGFFTFNYRKMGIGSSGHQLGHPVDEFGRAFIPEATEIKFSVTINAMILMGAIQPATLIKLDVDGNELAILRGMEPWIKTAPLRSIQVEVHPRDKLQVLQFMEPYGFELTDTHYTAGGQESIATGVPPEKVSHNVVFHRV